MFTSQFLPDGTKEQFDALNELQRLSTSPEGAVRYYNATGDVDVTGLLPQITAPTLSDAQCGTMQMYLLKWVDKWQPAFRGHTLWRCQETAMP